MNTGTHNGWHFQNTVALVVAAGLTAGVFGQPCAPYWSDRFASAFDGTVSALVWYDDGAGPALYAAGDFTRAGGVPARGIARWNGQRWSAVGDPNAAGLDSYAAALAVHDDGTGPALYVSGQFSSAGGVPANRIARWNGHTWSALGAGLTLPGHLVSFDDGAGPALYAGYVATGLPSTSRVSRWRNGAWSPVGVITNGLVYQLGVYDDGNGPRLVAAGTIRVADGQTVNNVARWDGTTWGPLGSGLAHSAYALGVYSPAGAPASLIVATQESSGLFPDTRLMRWDGGSWTQIGWIPQGYTPTLTPWQDGGTAAFCAAGYMSTVNGIATGNVARWDGATWSAVGSGASALIRTAIPGTPGAPGLWLGGAFVLAGGAPASRVTHWTGTQYEPVGVTAIGQCIADGSVQALLPARLAGAATPHLFAGGRFTQAGSCVAPYVAEWYGAGWRPLGDGLGGDYPEGGTTQIYGPSVEGLAVFDDGGGAALYVTGDFITAGGLICNNIARWDGAAWQPLDTGLDAWGRGLAVFDAGNGPALYVGGLFSQAGSVAANRLASWNGTSWSAVPDYTISGTVYVLYVYDDGAGPALYVGGDYLMYYSGGGSAAYLSKWNGQTWTSLQYPGTPVHALQAFGGKLYIGAKSRLVAWDGTNYTPVADSDLPQRSLAVFDDGAGPALFVGGEFTQIGGIAAGYLARFDGSVWSSPAGGVSNNGMRAPAAFVRALAVHDDGGPAGAALYVGGYFLTAGPQSAACLAEWRRAGTPVSGDVNCDTHVDFGDINPFVQMLSDLPGWQATYPCCPVSNGDINRDGHVDFGDINPFVALLSQS